VPIRPPVLDLKWTWRVVAPGRLQITTIGVPGPSSSIAGKNHAVLANLDYASAGHTGFAGTGVENTFTETQHFDDLDANLVIASSGLHVQTFGSPTTFDLNNGRRQETTLTDDSHVLAVANDASGMAFVIILVQDSVGGYAVTWWPNIRWAGGVEQQPEPGANKISVFHFLRRGTEYLATYALNL